MLNPLPGASHPALSTTKAGPYDEAVTETCPECGFLLMSGAKDCPRCGQELAVIDLLAWHRLSLGLAIASVLATIGGLILIVLASG